METTQVLQKEEKDNKRIKIDFSSDANENVSKLIERGILNLSLAVQVLPAKELESFLQKRFNLIKIKVSELEVETTKRLIGAFTPRRYNQKPAVVDPEKSFLEDLLNLDDIVINEEDKIAWGTKKVKLSLSEDSEFFTKAKSYSVGNTPKGVKIEVFMSDGKPLLKKPIFTIPGLKIDESTKNSLYRNIAIGGKFNCIERYESKDYSRDNMYKVLDLDYLMSLLNILENCYMYVDQDTSFLYNRQNSFYNLDYTIEDFENILNLKFLTQKNLNIPSKTQHIICESALAITHSKMSYALSEKYMEETKNIYNKSFKKKNNVSDNAKAVMANSSFLELFSSVELDEDMDIEKFYLIENEFEKLKDLLQLQRFINKDAEIKFKKLRKQNGLYFKEQNCICVNTENQSSFIHEIAHLIDSKLYSNYLASMSPDFRILAIKYIQQLEQNAEHLESSKLKEYKKARMNFHTPTEVFARAFELYLCKIKRLSTSFITEEANMTIENGYPELDSNLLNMIQNYFSNIIDLNSNVNIATNESDENLIISNIPSESTEFTENQVTDNQEDTEDENITIIEDENGVNFIFKIVQDARSNNQNVRYSSRRRRLNKGAVNEDGLASQLAFF